MLAVQKWNKGPLKATFVIFSAALSGTTKGFIQMHICRSSPQDL